MIWNKINNLVTGKQNIVTYSSIQGIEKMGDQYFFPRNLNSKSDPSVYLREAYATNPYIYSAINNTSHKAARLHLLLLDDKKNEVRNPFIKSLIEPRGQRDSTEDMYYRIHASYMAAGEAFIWGVKSDFVNGYRELRVPVVSNVYINDDGKGNVLFYEVTWFNQSFQVQPEDMLHVYNPDIVFDDMRGRATLEALRTPFEANNALNENEKYIHKHKGENGILINRQAVKSLPQERKKMQEEYNKGRQKSKAGSIRYEEGDFMYINTSQSMVDMQADSTRLAHLRMFCAAFDLDPQLFGDVQGAKYDNMVTAEGRQYTDCILPQCRKIYGELSEWLINGVYKTKGRIEVDTSKIPALNKMNKEKHDTIRSDFQAGLIDLDLAQSELYPQYYGI